MYIEATPPNLDGNTYNRSDLQGQGKWAVVYTEVFIFKFLVGGTE